MYLRKASGTSGGSGPTLSIGPCLAPDGTEYTGLVIGDLTLTKNGTSAAMAANATLTHTSNGHYDLVMIGNNVDTEGRGRIRCNKSGYQIPPVSFTVLPATSFDTLIANGTLASTAAGATIAFDDGAVNCNVTRVGSETAQGDNGYLRVRVDKIETVEVTNAAATSFVEYFNTAIVKKICGVGSTTTVVVTTDTTDAEMVWKNRAIVWTSGANAGMWNTVGSYDYDAGKVVFQVSETLAFAPADEDEFLLVDLGNVGLRAAIKSQLDTITTKTNALPAAPAATGDIPTANQNADALLDRANGIETGVTPRQAMRLSARADGAKIVKTGDSYAVRDLADTKDAIVADGSSGGRTITSRDLT